MLLQDVNVLVRAMERAPIGFRYFKDGFALRLLAYAIGGGRPIAALRAGPFGKLLERPVVRQALARASAGLLRPQHVNGARQRGDEFRITLGRWGSDDPDDRASGYTQTSRVGHNLVIQLGFPKGHDRAYRRFVGVRAVHPFAFESHPVRSSEPFTLAWARIDFETATGEALIEEVQSDWVREAAALEHSVERWLSRGEPGGVWPDEYCDASAASLLVYLERVLRPYAKLWAECVLSATIDFIYERLGLRTIYFHTPESGRIMKRLTSRGGPPRSLYTDLPRRFCFQRTAQAPRFLRGLREVRGDLEWHVLRV